MKLINFIPVQFKPENQRIFYKGAILNGFTPTKQGFSHRIYFKFAGFVSVQLFEMLLVDIKIQKIKIYPFELIFYY